MVYYCICIHNANAIDWSEHSDLTTSRDRTHTSSACLQTVKLKVQHVPFLKICYFNTIVPSLIEHQSCTFWLLGDSEIHQTVFEHFPQRKFTFLKNKTKKTTHLHFVLQQIILQFYFFLLHRNDNVAQCAASSNRVISSFLIRVFSGKGSPGVEAFSRLSKMSNIC